MNFFCSHDRAHSLDEAHHGHWEFNHSVPRRCGNLKSSWSDLTEPDTQYGCHFSWDTTFREVGAFLGYKKLLLGKHVFFWDSKNFFWDSKNFFWDSKNFLLGNIFCDSKNFFGIQKTFWGCRGFFPDAKRKCWQKSQKKHHEKYNNTKLFFFTNVAVGAQLYDPCLLEIVARRPVYVRLALWFLPPSCLGGGPHGWVPVDTHSTPVPSSTGEAVGGLCSI